MHLRRVHLASILRGRITYTVLYSPHGVTRGLNGPFENLLVDAHAVAIQSVGPRPCASRCLRCCSQRFCRD
eukprot:11922705-Prorocentrum_lima.AAC.1